jgi:hypothetical protein
MIDAAEHYQSEISDHPNLQFISGENHLLNALPDILFHSIYILKPNCIILHLATSWEYLLKYPI